MRQFAPDLQERRKLHRRGLAHGPPEERPLRCRIEPVPVLDDVAKTVGPSGCGCPISRYLLFMNTDPTPCSGGDGQ